MSTRSFISRLNENGSITGVYCHHDGYPDGVGAMLRNNYTTPDMVESLLSLGDLSCLGPTINNGTIAYARDRGEELEPLTTYTTLSEAISEAWMELGAEYIYVYDGTCWKCAGLYKEAELRTL